MNLQDQIKTAIGSHGLWKARLRAAITSASSEFSPAIVRKDDQCDFGQWLRSGSDPSLRGSRQMNRCAELHRQFHEAAAKVLALAVEGKKEAAQQAMSPASEFAKVSAALTTAMREWSGSASKQVA